MSDTLNGTGGLVGRFAGGTDRGPCYQVNGASRIIENGGTRTVGSETQLTATQARIVAEAILLDLAHRGEYGPVAIAALAQGLRRATRRTVRP